MTFWNRLDFEVNLMSMSKWAIESSRFFKIVNNWPILVKSFRNWQFHWVTLDHLIKLTLPNDLIWPQNFIQFGQNVHFWYKTFFAQSSPTPEIRLFHIKNPNMDWLMDQFGQNNDLKMTLVDLKTIFNGIWINLAKEWWLSIFLMHMDSDWLF